MRCNTEEGAVAIGQHPFLTRHNMSDDIQDEPLFSFTDEELRQRDANLLIVEFQKVTIVSPRMRRECMAELEEAKKNNYRFKKS